ncbi:MAG: hypothetical protein KAS65_12465 [Candidatus Aminicenantes bacterium]|nr:hypothetical protein [Candidatus Aminicenantes bacterium]
MRTILFQFIPNSEPNTSPAFPMWVFWLLLAIIVVLLIFILVRDKRARGKIRAFFSWIGSKIRMARIKSKINRKTQEKMKVIARLGQLAWDNQIDLVEIGSETREIKKLKEDLVLINNDIHKLDSELEKHLTRTEAIKKDHDTGISLLEEKKKPLALHHKKLLRQIDSIGNKIKENDKLKTKLARNIRHQIQEMEKTGKDGYLSKIEKDLKLKEYEKKIEVLKQKEPRFQSIQNTAEVEKQNIRGQITELNVKIDEMESQINGLKKEFSEQNKKDEEVIENLQKNRKALSIKKIGIEKQLTVLFEKTGEKLNQNRPDRAELKEIYSRIDLIDQSIQELESKMK